MSDKLVKELESRTQADMYKDMFDASCEEKKWLLWENKQLEGELEVANKLLREQA